LIFIDHYKEVYLRDFKILEKVGLIKSETMIVADNVITPGAPDYLEYIRTNPNYITKMYEAKLEYREDLVDGIEISIRK
jgi:predicted O-methyltransferase YrrM